MGQHLKRGLKFVTDEGETAVMHGESSGPGQEMGGRVEIRAKQKEWGKDQPVHLELGLPYPCQPRGRSAALQGRRLTDAYLQSTILTEKGVSGDQRFNVRVGRGGGRVVGVEW